MQTKLLGDDLDFLAWGICPECGESYNLVQHDESHYECQCGWKFTILYGDVFASNEQPDETHFDVLS
jgi:hypothetical protein